MTTFPFDDSIPAANNNPSADQSKMLINNDSTKKILAVDHITFQAQNGGTHQQVTYIDKFPAGPQVDPVSVAYTKSGTANTAPQNFFRNSQGDFQLSAIRAWALCYCGIGGVVTIPNSQSVNVASVTRASVGVYNVTLTANAVNTIDFAILLSASGITAFTTDPVIYTYTVTGIGTFTIKVYIANVIPYTPIDADSFSFSVIQV